MVTEAPSVNPVAFMGLANEQVYKSESSSIKSPMIEGQNAMIRFATETGMMCAKCQGCEGCPIFKMKNKTLLEVTSVEDEVKTQPTPTVGETIHNYSPAPVLMPSLWETRPTPVKISESPKQKDVVGWPVDMPKPTLTDLIPEVKPVFRPIAEQQPKEQIVMKKRVESTPEKKAIDSSIIGTIEPPEKTTERISVANEPAVIEVPPVDTSGIQTTEVPVVAELISTPDAKEDEGGEQEQIVAPVEEIYEETPMETVRPEKHEEQVKPDEPPQLQEDLTAAMVMPETAELPEPAIDTPQALFDEIVRIAQGPPAEFVSRDEPSQENNDEEEKEEDIVILKSRDKVVAIERKKLLRILPALHPNLQRSVEYKTLVEELKNVEEEQIQVVKENEYIEFAQEELLWQNTRSVQLPVKLLFYFWLLLRKEVLDRVHEESKSSNDHKRYPQLDDRAVLWMN